MRQDKAKAYALRKKGFSYASIVHELRIPKSTLSNWFTKKNWSNAIRQSLSQEARLKARRRMTEMSRKASRIRLERYKKRHQEAQVSFHVFKRDPLFIAGLITYWCEGDSKLENGIIRVTNTDPTMLKMFGKFLLNYLSVPLERIRAYLILYPDLEEKTCLRYWSQGIGIPQKAFFKSHYIKGSHPTKRLSHGICTIMTSSRELKEVVLSWLACYRQEQASLMRE